MYGITLAIGLSMFAITYFLTLFMQDVLGYGPMKAGVAYLPFALVIVTVAGATSRFVGRFGTKAPLVIGTALGALGLLWFAQVTPTSSYAAGLLGPMLVTGAGVAMCFVPLTLEAVSGVHTDEQGIASALLNSGQQVGGSLGLAVLGTIAVRDHPARDQTASWPGSDRRRRLRPDTWARPLLPTAHPFPRSFTTASPRPSWRATPRPLPSERPSWRGRSCWRSWECDARRRPRTWPPRRTWLRRSRPNDALIIGRRLPHHGAPEPAGQLRTHSMR